MPGLPRMALDPPPGYVAFVRRHLASLRRDAGRVVGERRYPDELYPDVLTDVAARWGWLELLRTRLGRAEAADTYLDHAFARQCLRWRSDQPGDPDPPPIDFEVWRSDAPAWSGGAGANAWSGGAGAWSGGAGWAVPARTSAALRLAPRFQPDGGDDGAPIAEAAIAWLHAYAARRQRRIVATVVGILVLLFAMFRLSVGL